MCDDTIFNSLIDDTNNIYYYYVFLNHDIPNIDICTNVESPIYEFSYQIDEDFDVDVHQAYIHRHDQTRVGTIHYKVVRDTHGEFVSLDLDKINASSKVIMSFLFDRLSIIKLKKKEESLRIQEL